jgi:hypothetical protein
MDDRIKGHVYVNFKAKNEDFNLLCYVAGNSLWVIEGKPY